MFVYDFFLNWSGKNGIVREIENILGDIIELFVEKNVVTTGLGEFNADFGVINLQNSDAEIGVLD